MGQEREQQGPAEPGREAALLLGLARQLRDAATRAGRPDVAAKAEEIIGLVTTGPGPVDRAEEKGGRDAKGNAVVRFLDGLGF